MPTTDNLLVTVLSESQSQKAVSVNNGFQVFDRAIAGSISKAITTTDVTLTDEEAQAAIIFLTGTLTGNRNLIVPARSKIYVIQNGTAGAFTVTVKTSGGSGVIVTQGVTAQVMCDGTNVDGISGYLTVEEADASPSVKTVSKIKVTNAALTDDGSGVVSISTGGSPGSGTNNIEIGAYASRPAAGNDGAVYLSSDGLVMSVDDGVDWKHFGPIYPLQMDAQVSDFTWVNQGSATATDSGGGIRVAITNSGTSIRILKKTAPSPPYTLTVAIQPPLLFTTDGARAFRTGVGWRSSGDSKITYVAIGCDAATLQLRVYTATNETTGFTGVAAVPLQAWGPLVWLRIEDDNTNRKVYLSATGLASEWIEVYSVARTTHHTPDEIGLFFDCNHLTLTNISAYYHYVEA